MEDKFELCKRENSSERIVTTKDDIEETSNENFEESNNLFINEKNDRKNSDDTENEEYLVFQNHTKFKLENILKDFFEKEKMEQMEQKFTNDIQELEKDKYSFIFDVVKRKNFLLNVKNYLMIFKTYK